MVALIGDDVFFAASLLKQGKLVAIPTETVYGLAANALDAGAVASIFEAKGRPFFDPLICHIHSFDQIRLYGKDIPPVAYKLTESFWPGPMTLILPKKDIIPGITTSGNPTVGLRMPAHSLTLELMRLLDFPLAAPSANPFNYVSPTRAEHVARQLGDRIPYILDGGPCKVGVESTIVGFNEYGETLIYRQGGIPVHEIEKIAGKVKLSLHQSSDPMAPGQLKHHYATSKQIVIGDIPALIEKYAGQKIGVISFYKSFTSQSIKRQWPLSLNKSLTEAATNLFHAMREADMADIDIILTENFPEEGLGAAINDRLRRAAARY